MDFSLSPTQTRAWYFLDHVTLDDNEDTIDDDLENPDISAWPPLLDRRLAAQYLGIGMSQLSAMTGNGSQGRRLQNCIVRGRVHWRLEDLQSYQKADIINIV